MLDFLLAFICIGSTYNSDACNQSWNKANESHPEINEMTKELERDYYEPSPEPVKMAGGAATIFYKKELKINIYHGTFIDVKDMGRISLGKKWSF